MALYDSKGTFQGVNPAAKGGLYGANGSLQTKAAAPASSALAGVRSLLPNLNQGSQIVKDARTVAKETLQSGRDILERQITGKQHPISSALQFLGLGAKAAGETVFGIPAKAVERAIPDAERKHVEAGVSKAASAVANTAPVKGAVQKAATFAQEHPEAAANIGAAGNIAGTFLGAGAAKEAAPLAENVLKAGSEAAGDLAARATGPISEHLATKAAAQEAERTLELTRPVLTASEKESALAAGRGKTGGILKADTIAPAARDIERAEVAHPFIAGTKDSNEAIANLNDAIEAKSNVIKQGLKKSGDPIFNRNQLRTYIAKFAKSPERQIILAGDEAASRAYSGVLDTFMRVVDKHPKTVSGLLDARKEFDGIAERGMKGVFGDGTATARKQAILDIRRQANQYIEDQIPTGDAMKAVLHQQNLLYEASENIAAKGAKNVGKSKAVQFLKAHPTAAKVGAAAIGGGVAASAGKELLGL